MKRYISMLLSLCMCCFLMACGNANQSTINPPDNLQETVKYKYLNESLANSHCKLSLQYELTTGTIDKGIITNNNGKYAVLANNSKYIVLTPSLPLARIQDNHAWQHLYGGFYYYSTENAWHIRAGDKIYHTYPIDGEVQWMEALSSCLQFITYKHNQYTLYTIDETGAIIQTQALEILNVQSSCNNTYLYTNSGILRKEAHKTLMTSTTKLPQNCVLLDTYQHYIANRQVTALYYFNINDSTLHYHYESKEDVYDIALPKGYTVSQIMWIEWCNGTINILMKDRTWWSSPATTASVVGFEFTMDTVATEWVQQHVVDVHVINGELLLSADDGYIYHHNSYHNGMEAWVGGWTWES